MPTVSIARERVADGTLPGVCIVCGADASRRLFPKISSPSLAWLLLSPLAGLVTFWLYILFGGGDGRFGFPFGDKHVHYWPRRARFIVGGFAAGVALIAAGVAQTPPAVPGQQDEPHRLMGVGGCWLIIFLPLFMAIHLSATRPTGRSRRALELSGASRQFALALETDQTTP